MPTTVFFRYPLSEPVILPPPARTLVPAPERRQPEGERGSLRAAIREGWRRWRSRTAISELDPYMLKDIGVTWAEAEHEANKPFWRA